MILEESFQILNEQAAARLGRVSHVLFDFDGTLSVLRQGWEDVMAPVMVEAICGDNLEDEAVEREVRAYIDQSAGILTIRQMEWLSQSVQRHGKEQPLSAREYKSLYLRRLMVRVHERTSRLERGVSSPADYLISGAQKFLSGLVENGARLYLASGTDHDDMVREAGALGMRPYFEERIYGALDDNEDHAKERVIERILDENGLSGDALLVIGDGPVEIREGAARGALTMGLATDEVIRSGWNQSKVVRLAAAGADLMAPDFTNSDLLLKLFFVPGALSEMERRLGVGGQRKA